MDDRSWAESSTTLSNVNPQGRNFPLMFIQGENLKASAFLCALPSSKTPRSSLNKLPPNEIRHCSSPRKPYERTWLWGREKKRRGGWVCRVSGESFFARAIIFESESVATVAHAENRSLARLFWGADQTLLSFIDGVILQRRDERRYQ